MTRLLAIGDIHGCSKALDLLLEQVSPTAEDRIVTLGDYVDRGPDAAGVLDRLIELKDSHRLMPLRGNHEIMLLDAHTGGLWRHTWPSCGGEETLASYAMNPDQPVSLDQLPEEHLKFLEQDLLPWYETDSHLFVHAFAAPESPMDQQPEANLYWRKYINPQPHASGKTWVCGHSPQRNGTPAVHEGSVCIDTYAYGVGGWLTCLDVLSGQCWQASESGETRRFELDKQVQG
jgi:serine/threonine protein phosphatase 1